MVIVTCIHGTWARGARWPAVEKIVTDAMRERGPVEVRYFEWSGRNSVRARANAAGRLRAFLLQQLSQSPGARLVLVAHSHGANIVLHALDGAAPEIVQALDDVVLMSPPLLTCKLVGNPAAASNKLLVGALAVVPVFLLASAYATGLGFSGMAGVVAFLAVTALWLRLFWPTRVRRRAETIARLLTLPRVDVRGLVIRAPGDQATAALMAAGLFSALTRYVWSRILRVRDPFHESLERNLRDARRGFDLTLSSGVALAMVPTSVTWLAWMGKAAEDGNWMTLAVSLPLGIMTMTAAVVTVGGAVLLLLLLPAFALLLWPFGVFPTIAAGLLTASVQTAPTRSWRVVHLPERRTHGSGWTHSLYRDPAALDAIAAHLAAVR